MNNLIFIGPLDRNNDRSITYINAYTESFEDLHRSIARTRIARRPKIPLKYVKTSVWCGIRRYIPYNYFTRQIISPVKYRIVTMNH